MIGLEKQEYLCTIDGEQFASKEELLSYMEKQYVKVIKVKKDLQEETEVLKKAFPGFFISVKEQEDIIHVKMEMEGVEGEAKFEIKEKEQDKWGGRPRVFTKLEEAVSFFNTFFQKVDLVLSNVYLKMKTYKPNIKEIRLKSFHCGGEVADDYYEILPVAVLDNDHEMQIRKLEIEESAIHNDRYFYEFLQVYLRKIDADFITEIEGAVARNYNPNDYYAEQWYEVDGINLNILAERAKRLYVKIIEEN